MARALGLLALVCAACAAPAGAPSASPTPATETASVAMRTLAAAPVCADVTTTGIESVTCAKADPDAVDEALERIDADRCSLAVPQKALDAGKLDAKDPRLLELVRTTQGKALSLPPRGRALAAAFDDALDSDAPVARAIAVAAKVRGTDVHACPDATWYAPVRADAPLAQALAEARGNSDAIDADEVNGIAIDLQVALVPIVRALVAGSKAVEIARAKSGATPDTLRGVGSVPSWILGVRHFEWSSAVPLAFETIDVDAIADAAAKLSRVVESAGLVRFAGAKVTTRELTTPYGVIVLSGPSNDVWPAREQAPLFFLDTGGDDTYIGPVGAATVAQPISIAFDLDGSDHYTYAETRVPADAVGKRLSSDGAGRADDGRTLSRVGRQGSGTLGIGLLFDLGKGDDTYRSLLASQGAGSHGVGVLYDQGGNDRYEAEGFSQGAAAWGIGLLLDADGNDTFTLYNSGQGFGFTRGVGALVDRRGNDLYTANPGDASLDGDVLYPADQLPGPPTSPVRGNHSFAQGCGAGHRPDWPDVGHPFPGGAGILRDAQGSDRYVASVFAQGCGFVQGIGMLLEGAGNDTYEGLYYVQGAAAHSGVAFFDERDGADMYDPTFPIQLASLGLANDLAIAIFSDEGGSDRVRAPDMALGSAIANGLAVFVNDGGTDRFDAASATFGTAATGDVTGVRKTAATVGFFVKARGGATYTVASQSQARAGKIWCDGVDEDLLQKAVGIDRPNGRASL